MCLQLKGRNVQKFSKFFSLYESLQNYLKSPPNLQHKNHCLITFAEDELPQIWISTGWSFNNDGNLFRLPSIVWQNRQCDTFQGGHDANSVAHGTVRPRHVEDLERSLF